MLDVDDTTHCPIGVRCEVDGRERSDLIVATYRTPLGVLCLTICPDHVAPEVSPPVSVGTANRLVIQHCLHLGCTVDDMSEALEGEPTRE